MFGPRSRSARRRSRLVWAFGALALAAVLLAASLGATPLARLTPLVFDAYQRLAPRAEAGAPVVVVDIDEASIAELGQWPWSRAVVARMVDRLGELGAANIAFDMVFPEADRTSLRRAAADLERVGATVRLPEAALARDNDALLAEAFARNGVTAGLAISNETQSPLPDPKSGLSFGGADPRSYLPSFSGGLSNLPGLDEAAAGLGFFSFPQSRDGIVRVVPLVAAAQGRIYPALSVEALRVAQGAGSLIVRSTGASGEADTGVAAMTALRAGALEAPTGPRGEFWVHFSGLKSMPTISAASLLDPARGAGLGDIVAGRIVLVGTGAVGLRDLVPTPIDPSMPGVRVHAEIIDQIVGQQFLTRPDWAAGAEIVAALALGFAVVAVAGRFGAVATTAAALLSLGAAVGASWLAFSQAQLLVDPILPGAGVAAVFAVTMPLLLLLTDREKRFVRGAFGRYLAPALVERLADHPDALKLGGETREITILFSDIRGFTALSENLDPSELTQLLNDLLTPTTDVLLGSEATIDKYIGDAIMAFWNAPLDIAGHRRKACLAALDMQTAVDALNRARGTALRMGIGLHTGPACVGNLGSAQRFSYSAIGDSVNLASRVEGLTKAYGLPILVTDETRRGAEGLAFVEADRVRVVGRAEPVGLHALIGDEAVAAGAPFRALAEAHGRLVAAYRAGDLDGAEAALQAVGGHGFPELERLHGIYGERLAAMRADPPSAGWDGVFVAREK